MAVAAPCTLDQREDSICVCVGGGVVAAGVLVDLGHVSEKT